MEKRVFLAILICVGVFAAWQRFYMAPYLEAQRAYQLSLQQTDPQKGATPPPAAGAPGTVDPVKDSRGDAKIAAATPRAVPTEVISFSGEGLSLDVTSEDGSIRNQKLGSFQGQSTDALANLISAEKQFTLSTNASEWNYLSRVPYSVISKSPESLVLSYEDQNLKITRTYQFFPKLHSLDQTIDLNFKKQPAPPFVFVEMHAHLDVEKVENEKRDLILNKNKEQSSFEISSLKEAKDDLGEVHWLGFASRYFLNAAVDLSAEGKKPQFQSRPAENGSVAASLAYKTQGPVLQIPLRTYFGPKQVDMLKAAHSRLGSAVDFGWFTVFAYPLLQGLKWFYNYVRNFGIAIILLTVLVKLLTYPLTYKSMKSMKEMQRIQPQLTKLREKYSGPENKEALNREMLQLMKANGYNPMSGCLPILVQMPIYIALYNVLNNSIELYGQPFFGWIHDLSQKDPYFVTPVLLAIMMFLQQKMTPNTSTDPAQQKMMTMMPVIFGVMMLWLPSGLTLYMLVNSVVSILQQVFINRSFASKAIA